MNDKRKQRHWNDAEDRRLNRYWNGALRDIPTWPTTFPNPRRLRDMFYGIADSAVDPLTLARAQHDFPPAKVSKWAALSPKPDLQLRWEKSLLWPNPGSTFMSSSCYAGIKYIVQSYLWAGMNVSLAPQDNVGAVYRDLHHNSGYTWQWLVDGWIALVQQLEADLHPYGFGPNRVTLEIVNEMGNAPPPGLQSLWSMPLYNDMWSYVIPKLRAGLRDYTFLIDLYPFATPNQFIDTSFGGNGTLLALPSDRNLVIAMHCYHPGNFTQQGIGGDDNWDRKYLAGMNWGWSKAQIGSYLSTYDAFGQYATGNAVLDAQVAYWRANWPTQIEALGFTKAEIESQLAGILSYCQANKRALCCPQWSALGVGSTTFPMPAAQANAYEADMTAIFYQYGIPNSYWIEQMLTDDLTRLDPNNVGSESFVPTRVAANVARNAPS